jgi:hypothetical protein
LFIIIQDLWHPQLANPKIPALRDDHFQQILFDILNLYVTCLGKRKENNSNIKQKETKKKTKNKSKTKTA